MSDPANPLRAALADRYPIERPLGSGGMATVYLARDLRHNRQVAVKVLHPALAAGLGPDRFLREVRIAAALQHPHILPLYDSGEAAGQLYYVMPYVEGETLRAQLERSGPLPVDEALRIGRDVLDALGHAHRHGVVHRDIKPENILLSDGHALVADFGIAKAVAAAGENRLTETGWGMGTPPYMSPEQIGGAASVDARSDLYALGCMLYEMLVGTPPFTGATAQAIFAQHVRDAAPSLRKQRPEVPEPVERAVSRSLAKAPEERFATAAEFAAALGAPIPARVLTPRRSIGGPQLAIGLLVVLAAAFGIRTVLRRAPNAAAGGAGTPPITSLAVLPFANLTGDTAQMYLAEGLTDQLVASLAQVGALRVIALREKPSDETKDRILSDNRIDATVAGSLQRAGNAVHITVNLISVSSNQTLWAHGYDGDLSNILNLQAEVARSVATELRASMTSQERSGLTAERPPVDPVAYDAYVRGNYFLGRGTTEAEHRKAIGYFQQAIAADPAYAAAYARLSVCYSQMGYLGMVRPQEVLPLAEAAALRAVALDSMLGGAHTAVARVEARYRWNFAAAEREYRRGIELNSKDPEGHFGYGLLLASLKRSDEAIAEMKVVQELDPLTLIYQAAAALPYYMAGRYQEAIAQSQKPLEIDSTYIRARYWLGMSYQETGRPLDAIREFEDLRARAPLPVYVAGLAHAYAVGGQRGKALQVLEELRERAKTSYVSSFDFASIYAGLGDRARMLEWLEKAYEERTPYLVYLNVNPQFDAFRADPTFRDLVRRIGLPD